MSEGKVASVSSAAPDRLRGEQGPPPEVSTAVTPAAWPHADPHLGPGPRTPGPPSSPAPRFPVAEVPLGVIPSAGSSASCFPLETQWKHGALPRPRRQTRLPCDSAGLELGPATRCPHAPLRGWKQGGLSWLGVGPLPPGEDGGAPGTGESPQPYPPWVSLGLASSRWSRRGQGRRIWKSRLTQGSPAGAAN